MNCTPCECPITFVAPKCKQKELEPTKDISSLDQYQLGKVVKIPFNLFWSPKPIVGPYKVSTEKYSLPEVTKYKTTLDTILSPACRLATVQNADVYKTIVADMYTSNKKRSDHDIASRLRPRRFGQAGFDSNEKKLNADEFVYKPIEKKYVDAAKEWDDKNVRCGSNPNCSFWKRFYAEKKRESSKRHDTNLVTPEVNENIRNLLKDEKLRLPHSGYPQTYDGHVVKDPCGVSLVKKVFPPEHVLKTAYGNDFKSQSQKQNNAPSGEFIQILITHMKDNNSRSAYT